jgi:hypothetical protein
MLNVSLRVEAINKDVVEVDDHQFADEWAEHLIHYSHKGTQSIRQSKWHHRPFIKALMHFKRGFPFITNPYLDLVVPTLQILFGKCSCPI